MAPGEDLHSGEKNGKGPPGLTLDVIRSILYYRQTQNTEMIVWAMK